MSTEKGQLIKFKHLGDKSQVIELSEIISIDPQEMDGSLAHKNCAWFSLRGGGIIRVRFDSEEQRTEKIIKIRQLMSVNRDVIEI